MTRNEAIESIKPDKCPTCGGKAFEVCDSNIVRLGGLYPHDVRLKCVSCEWKSAVTSWGYEPAPPEIVYADTDE